MINAAETDDRASHVLGGVGRLADGRTGGEGELPYTLMLADQTEVAGAMATDDETLRSNGLTWRGYRCSNTRRCQFSS
ncbi:MAG: hypothetical protein HC868_10705 [Sphingomonadales bacterium]|nr:hypothetical protein [Sphingomonadales bacterium]